MRLGTHIGNEYKTVGVQKEPRLEKNIKQLVSNGHQVGNENKTIGVQMDTNWQSM